ncbi:hypothetical protein [Paraburkholderia sp. JHI869]|uniref:hypothetical protein n=1 Tax=Paraburkholderia sp. JHI869 TaxID=3112959 RepID=UPI00317740CD
MSLANYMAGNKRDQSCAGRVEQGDVPSLGFVVCGKQRKLSIRGDFEQLRRMQCIIAARQLATVHEKACGHQLEKWRIGERRTPRYVSERFVGVWPALIVDHPG